MPFLTSFTDALSAIFSRATVFHINNTGQKKGSIRSLETRPHLHLKLAHEQEVVPMTFRASRPVLPPHLFWFVDFCFSGAFFLI